MRVVAMSLLDCSYYMLAGLTVILSITSQYWYPLSYIAALFLVTMFIILFLSIPLKLNWSSNLYRHLFWRFLSFLMFTILIYAVCYHFVGFERADGSRPTFIESLYFSVTTFTTLQYGEFRPLVRSRPLACIESLMGIIAFVPCFAAFIWLYCQNRLWHKSIEYRSVPEGLEVRYDPILGGWKEPENERAKAEAEERNARIRGVSCALCGSTNPKIDKYYDIVGRITPLAHYVVYCPCGQISKPSTTAFLAVWRWKRLNQGKSKKR